MKALSQKYGVEAVSHNNSSILQKETAEVDPPSYEEATKGVALPNYQEREG
jgi:hypothetical protein